MALSRRKMTASRKKDLGFQLILLAWPVIQFLIFYVYVNINSIKLAFNFGESSGDFLTYFRLCFSGDNPLYYLEGAGVSVGLWFVTSLISIPLALLFAYFIYKKFRGSKLFRFLLFLPSIISATVMIVSFKKMTDFDLVVFAQENLGIQDAISITSSSNPYSLWTVIAFYIFVNFGTTTLIYSNRMSEISTEVVEAARLDGVNRFEEFWHIILPGIWPTLSTFIITSIATMFTNQYFLFTFFSSDIGKLGTGPLGYILYNQVQGSFLHDYDTASLVFHKTAAIGLLSTFVIIPLVFGTKALLKKFGPSEK